MSDPACLSSILGYCDDVSLVSHSYAAHEEMEFLTQEAISAVVFCPNERYELLTPGTVMDCVRIGCYCLSPAASPIAIELVGNLAITDIRAASADPKEIIESLTKERLLLNKQQLARLINATA